MGEAATQDFRPRGGGNPAVDTTDHRLREPVILGGYGVAQFAWQMLEGPRSVVLNLGAFPALVADDLLEQQP
jgi:hypothetical protein